jgi:hypothetical protein
MNKNTEAPKNHRISPLYTDPDLPVCLICGRRVGINYKAPTKGSGWTHL